MNPDLQPHHAFVEHTGEERLLVHSPTLAGLFTQSGRALAELQGVTTTVPDDAQWRPVEVTATDSAGLLVEWLNELIFLAEHERWVPVEFRVDLITPTRLRVWGRGPTVPVAPSRVKAATRHGLEVVRHDAGYRGEVVLDV
jgi:SHS2 domain-containing protein